MPHSPAPTVPAPVLIGCKSHGPAWDANTHRIIVTSEDEGAFYGYPVDNPEPWTRKQSPVGPLQYPKFAWEVRTTKEAHHG